MDEPPMDRTTARPTLRQLLSAPHVLALMSAAIVLNIVGGELITALKLPVYGDSTGTILVGALCGPAVGAITGALSNLLWGLRTPTNAFFAPSSAAIGALAGLFARLGLLKALTTAVGIRGTAGAKRTAMAAVGLVMAGLAIGFGGALVSTPIATYVFGGVTGGGTDAVVAFFRASGASLIQSVLGQSIVSDPLDKLATTLLAMTIVIALPTRLVVRFPLGARLIGSVADDGGS